MILSEKCRGLQKICTQGQGAPDVFDCTEEDKKLAKQKYIDDQQQVMKASPVGLFCTILDTV